MPHQGVGVDVEVWLVGGAIAVRPRCVRNAVFQGGTFYVLHGIRSENVVLRKRWNTAQAANMRVASMMPSGATFNDVDKELLQQIRDTTYRITVRNATVLTDLGKKFPLTTELFNVATSDGEDRRRSATANAVCDIEVAKALAKEPGVIITPLTFICDGVDASCAATLRTKFGSNMRPLTRSSPRDGGAGGNSASCARSNQTR